MDKEKYFSVAGIKGYKEQAVASSVAEVLLLFCTQAPEFEQAIAQSGKTFQDCLSKITQKIGNSISDLELYKRAVKFYFSTADVRFNMLIDLCGNIENETEHSKKIQETSVQSPEPEKKSLSISLDDLLDF